ncbi:MAG: AraC family transcriptional regulator [Eubacteriales bacterium]
MAFEMIEREFRARYKRSFYNSPSLQTRQQFSYVLGAGHYICLPQYKIHRRGFDCFLMLLTLHGKGQLTYQGREYELNPNDLFLIDCNQVHLYRTTGEEWDFVWMHFAGGGCPGYYQYISETFGNLIHLGTPNNSSILEADIHSVMGMLEQNVYRLDINSSLLVYQVLNKVINLALNASEPLQVRLESSREIKNAISYITQHYQNPISIEELASQNGFSKYYFIRKFKQYTGSTPYEYLLSHRISVADRLLRSTEMPVEEISYSVGFDSPSNFIKQFKRYMGVTPANYRKMMHLF